MTPGTEQRKLAAIMFTDMVGYSALAQRNDPLALELLEEHPTLLRVLFLPTPGAALLDRHPPHFSTAVYK